MPERALSFIERPGRRRAAPSPPRDPAEHGLILEAPRPVSYTRPLMFARILVANRGEIALRIIRACKEMGIESVAVYSEADRNNDYLKLADYAICIGPGPAQKSYLDISRIVSAAEIADVDAIHPGYGFLSENAHFADVCESCNIRFIGPSSRAMNALEDKAVSRALAKKAGVPTPPGS